MIWLAVVFVILMGAALHAHRRLSTAERRTGLPQGHVVYVDTSDMAVHCEPFLSYKYALIGRPDFIVQGANGSVIPVEVKSATCPASGAYGNHVAQLMGYCLLLEDTLHRPVTEGVLKYRNRDVRVSFDDENRQKVLGVIAAIRAAKVGEMVGRDHTRLNKCRACVYRGTCPDPIQSGL